MKRDFKYYFLYLYSSFIPFFVLFSHFDIVETTYLIYLSILLVAILISFLTKNKRLRKVNILVFIGLIVLLILNYKGIGTAFVQIFNAVVKEYNKNTGINISSIMISVDKNTIFYHVCLLVVVIQYFISNVFIRLLNKQKYGKIFLITLFFSLPIIIVQINLNWVAWVLLITYWFTLYVYHYFKNAMNKDKLVKLSVLILTTLSLSSFLFIHNFSEHQLKLYYEPVTIQQDVLDKVNEWIQKISDLQVNNHEVDLSYARNRVYSDTVHLEVETDHVQPYYLKYYSGAVYSDNKWSALSDQVVKNSKLDDEDFDNVFHYIQRYTLSPNDVDQITVTDKRRGDTFSIYPYYIRTMDQEYEIYRDMYMIYRSDKATFQTWDTDKVTYSVSRPEEYIQFVNKNYTFVPLKIETLFQSKFDFKEYNPYLNENRFDFAKEQILTLLKDYTYTLSPGGTPNDKDFIEYFLTENKKGYCVHFASAATLMFRYYGIPARYVEGYYVSPSQFKDGVAEVLDSDAHAWVEIFDNYLGWIPVEVTVGQNEDEENIPVTPNTPNQPNNQLNNQQNPNNPNNLNNQQNNEILPLIPNGNNELDTKEFDIKCIYLLVVLILIIIYLIYRLICIKRRIKKLNQKDRKQSVYELYDYLMRINKYSNVMNDEMIQLFEKNKFSIDGLDIEEYKHLRRITHLIPKNTYQTLKPIEKLKYKYIECLI